MMIHPSHPRRDLIHIIELFDIPIDNPNSSTKAILNASLLQEFEKDKPPEIKPDLEFFFIEDWDDLRRYLEEKSPRQSFPMKVQDEIFILSRNIIFYCKECTYSLAASTYTEIDDVLADAEDISRWGDNSSVRRALRLLSKDPKLSGYDVPIPCITQKMQVRLKKLDYIKKMTTPKFSLNYGEFYVEFP